MAIIYDWYENPGESGDSEERGLHPRLFLNGKVGTAKLCRLIHGRSSLSVGDAKSTLEMLAQICSEELCEGREVHIEGAWLFCPYLEKCAESDPRLLLNRPFLTNFRLEMTNVLYWDGLSGTPSIEINSNKRMKLIIIVLLCLGTLFASSSYLLFYRTYLQWQDQYKNSNIRTIRTIIR